MCKLKYNVSSSSTHAKLKEKKENLQFFLSPIVKQNALNLPLHLNSEVGKEHFDHPLPLSVFVRPQFPTYFWFIYGNVPISPPPPSLPPLPPSPPSLPLSLKNVTRVKKRVLTKRKITKYAPQRYNLNPSSPKRHQHQIYPCHIEQILPTTPTENV